jgi:hypothetical protein
VIVYTNNQENGAGQGLIVITYYPLTNNSDPLTGDNIDEPYGTGLGATTNPDASKTITFSSSQPGSYTFYAMAQSSYYSSWAQYASTTVTVIQAATCSPATQYICTGSGNNIIAASSTDAYCNHTQTTVTSCVSPAFCQSGANSCSYPAISINSSGNFTGDLQVIPNILSSGETTKVYWNVANAQSCTVTGTNGDSWTGASGAQTTKAITGPTIYTLQCTAYSPNPNLSETQSVSVTPKFLEQ